MDIFQSWKTTEPSGLSEKKKKHTLPFHIDVLSLKNKKIIFTLLSNIEIFVTVNNSDSE